MYPTVYSPHFFWGSPHPQSPLPCDAAQGTKRRSGASAPLPHFVCHSPFPPVSAAALLLDRQETNGVSGLCPHTTLRFCVSPLWEVPFPPHTCLDGTRLVCVPFYQHVVLVGGKFAPTLRTVSGLTP